MAESLEFVFVIKSAAKESDSDFHDQVEAIKQAGATWNGRGSSCWNCRVDPADTERLASVMNQLFAVARRYGTLVCLMPPDSGPSATRPEAPGHSPS
jgi:hypothetical protein